jgi:hypothetical protein
MALTQNDVLANAPQDRPIMVHGTLGLAETEQKWIKVHFLPPYGWCPPGSFDAVENIDAWREVAPGTD